MIEAKCIIRTHKPSQISIEVGTIVKVRYSWFNSKATKQYITVATDKGVLDIPAAIFQVCFEVLSNRPKKSEKNKKHSCYICGHKGFQNDKDNPVSYGTDPYSSEVNNDYTLVWMCESCHSLRSEES